jgi:DNA-binding LacI/PurR family transcriptional regulator
VPEKNKVTIDDVAKVAGVSITTVSRVINAVPTVEKENRRRVLEAIKKLKFKPNLSAQVLAGAKPRTFALVVPRFQDMFTSFYVSEVLKGVSEETAQLDLDLLLHTTREKKEDSHIFNRGLVAGILFLDRVGNEARIAQAQEEGIGYCLMNYYEPAGEENCVAVDNRVAAYSAVEYLLKLGHQRIATICGDLYVQSAKERFAGYQEALEKNSVALRQEYIAQANWQKEAAEKAMENFLKLSVPPSAVFCASDEMALSAMEVVLKKGLKIPEDISFVGFDDIPLAAYAKTPLTTLRQPLAELGAQAVAVLNRVAFSVSPKPEKRLLKASLVERSSCKRI